MYDAIVTGFATWRLLCNVNTLSGLSQVSKVLFVNNIHYVRMCTLDPTGSYLTMSEFCPGHHRVRSQHYRIRLPCCHPWLLAQPYRRQLCDPDLDRTQ